MKERSPVVFIVDGDAAVRRLEVAGGYADSMSGATKVLAKRSRSSQSVNS